ncbi:hypothetical protein EJB05_39396 [Eragrostis curvula]|uniref:DDE Tnp4 domain-containing protein n=1 Tax=Eragrostis curvula TaxID=38414 RepID=A0A5J9TX31_9POAL|nr:hypothetical protein EJB05_39396 [Eragrostis curvula]
MAHVAEVMFQFGKKVICPKDPTYSTVSPKVAKWTPFFDGCIGALDGTHIEIRANKDSREDMRNRKGWTSFNVLAVVDHEMRFTFVGSGMSGACHDMHVLRESQTKSNFPAPPPVGRASLLPVASQKKNHNEVIGLVGGSLDVAVEARYDFASTHPWPWA